MPLRLPQLDDRTWSDLTEDARSLIPTFSSGWTNHNASDPGITLIELFAYYCESFLYRLNQISDANIRAFLKLIDGPDWRPTRYIEKDVRETLLDVRSIYRAVSAEDYEFLALATNVLLEPNATARVARAKCVARRNLDRSGPAALSDAPGHVSLLIVPNPVEADATSLVRSVRRAIEPARLVGARVHVVLPRYLPVAVRISVTAERNSVKGTVRDSVIAALRSFLDPLTGGPGGKGWPFGRSIYVSEIYELLAKMPGVESVEKTSKEGKLLDEVTVDPAAFSRLRRNSLGELEAVELEPNELVQANLQRDQITVISGWET